MPPNAASQARPLIAIVPSPGLVHVTLAFASGSSVKFVLCTATSPGSQSCHVGCETTALVQAGGSVPPLVVVQDSEFEIVPPQLNCWCVSGASPWLKDQGPLGFCVSLQ